MNIHRTRQLDLHRTIAYTQEIHSLGFGHLNRYEGFCRFFRLAQQLFSSFTEVFVAQIVFTAKPGGGQTALFLPAKQL
jgi:hypothetical protein